MEMTMRKLAWMLAVAIGSAAVVAIGGPPGDDARPGQREKKEQGSPIALEKAAAAMTVPEGFHVSLCAGEPDVHQPIGFCIDHRGRVWVAENDSYPKWEEKGKD